MSTRNFRQMLEAKWAEGKFVCVGLDSELSKIPEQVHVGKHNFGDEPDQPLDVRKTIGNFNRAIVHTTKDLVCAYKINTAFYEAYGPYGWWALEETMRYINRVAPDVPVILDAKRADIGNTNAGYVRMALERLKAHAITVHPYLGAEALAPFLDADMGIIVLCRTSNPGAGEFQNLSVSGGPIPCPLYRHVARRVAGVWNKNGNCALVVGATAPAELAEVREIVGDMPILIPGVGAQGGDVEMTVKAAKKNFIVNSSRGIIFASSGADFAAVARHETEKLHNLINQYRN